MNISYFEKVKIPDHPGVYFFKKDKDVLYIGKATSLKDRVRSYFGANLIETRGPVLVDMLFNAETISWQATDSVLEALILEAELIKKHQPKYNTKEKSDKSFNYVIVTKDKLPRVLIVRGANLKNWVFDKIYGPYTSGSQLREAVKIIRRIFPFLDEKSKNYLEFYKQINLVPDLNDRSLYLQNIKNIKLFFAGKKRQILSNLKKEMNFYAQNREFEKAGEIKRQLFALQHINDIALIKNEHKPLANSRFRIEAYDIAHMSGRNMVGVMVVVEDGEPTKNEYKRFKIKTQSNANDTGALKEVLERRFNHSEWNYPDLLVVDGGVAQINVAKSVLNKMATKIPIVSVLKNERHKPKDILGDENLISKYKKEILLGNGEAHRFAITYHKKMRAKNFLRQERVLALSFERDSI